ncbi:site-specific integrase [uncultured Megasphaera sp.]|uniref:tyrosine-type recombinase/integrase n=1 Tax=uncultured Megasphaera sp. TaxID=165188 RepID=UPI00266B8C94|nr:site-specific integrase [uncultured Megasphaera sp.]
MKNPNGYGCIRTMSGTRRRPYAFIATINGKQRYVASFETLYEAKIFQASYFAEHHKGHRPFRKKSVTFAELYFRWLPFHLNEDAELSESTKSSYENSFKHCATLYDRYFSDLEFLELQSIIDDMRNRQHLSYSSCKKVKNLLSLLYQYAIKSNICSTNYAALISIGKNHPIYPHHIISRQKINRLWRHADIPGVDSVLILLYTGLRVSEMLQIEKKNINLRQRFIRITKSKTSSGIRIVPIHPKIMPFILNRLSNPSDFLICDSSGNPYNYTRYRSSVWNKAMKLINGLNHTPHDTRHTVATLLDNAGANETSKRKILGHAGGDITERVYTHKGLRQLRKCIELLK